MKNGIDYDAWYKTGLGSLCLEREIRAIFALAAIKADDIALDLGCGTGTFSLEAARRGAHTIGIDSDSAMLSVARTKAESSGSPAIFLEANAQNLPFPREKFDLVLAVTVLCFASQPNLVLEEAFRVLKPGGRLVVGELNRSSYWAWLRRIKGIFRESVYREARFFSTVELGQLVTHSGFKPARIESLLFFPPLNSRLVLRSWSLFEKIGARLAADRGAFITVRAEKET